MNYIEEILTNILMLFLYLAIISTGGGSTLGIKLFKNS